MAAFGKVDLIIEAVQQLNTTTEFRTMLETLP